VSVPRFRLLRPKFAAAAAVDKTIQCYTLAA
jgi:hypothetical protein